MPPANSPSETRSLSPENTSRTAARIPLLVDRPSAEQRRSARGGSGTYLDEYTGNGDTNDDNVNFLRRHRVSPLSYTRATSAARREHLRRVIAAESTDPTSLEDAENHILAHRRLRIMRQRQAETANVPNYESSTNNVQSLYGWAPSADIDEAARSVLLHGSESLDTWFRGVEARHPSTFEGPNHGEALDPNPSHLTDEATVNDNGHTLTATEALFQAVRREPRLSRARALHHYISDRDSPNRTSQAPRRDYSPHRPSNLHTDGESSTDWPDLRSGGRRPGSHAYHLGDYRRPHMAGRDSPRVKDAIRYLHRLQYVDSHEDGLECAVSFGFVPPNGPASVHRDLALDTESITLPTECSWLRPGMVFSGSQKAAHSAISVYSHRIPGNLGPSFHYVADSRDLPGRPKYDWEENWPVKVTIHEVDYKEMTLSGTMEAHNIPDKTSTAHDAHIVTFLEGEIIDLKKHTLETMNFRANLDIDSRYWRQLCPFRVEDDEELVNNLVSRKWIEQLGEDFVLMRWKERCFITPADSRQGLTISGFYYIALHRDTGSIEGLYYDPGSSPYQQLTLKPERYTMVRPSYEFR